jgi:hypothetical protein
MSESYKDDWHILKGEDFNVLAEFMTLTEERIADCIDARKARTDMPLALNFDDFCHKHKMTPETPWFTLLITRAVYSRVWDITKVRTTKYPFYRVMSLTFIDQRRRQIVKDTMSRSVDYVELKEDDNARRERVSRASNEWLASAVTTSQTSQHTGSASDQSTVPDGQVKEGLQ